MKFNTWLDAEVGRLKNIADTFKISPSAVSQWRANGIPPDRMRDVHRLTNGEVSFEEMIPQVSQAADKAVSHV